MLRSLTLILALAAPAAYAEELVTREILSEQPLTGAEGMKVVTARLTVKPGGRISLHTHEGDENSIVLVGGKVKLPNGTETMFPDDAPIFFAAGQVHGGVTNIDDHDLVLMQSFVVSDSAPLSTPAE